MHYDFIQVGAHIGRGDKVDARIRTGEYSSGILLEPLPHLFEQLKVHFSERGSGFHLVNAAIHPDKDTETVDFIPECEGFPDWASGIGSMIPLVTKKHLDMLVEQSDGRIPEFEQCTVNCLTFEKLFEQFSVESVGHLYIDAEGMDWPILQSFDFTTYRPQRVIFEHLHMDEDTQARALRFMVHHGYTVSLDSEDTEAGDTECDYICILDSAT